MLRIKNFTSLKYKILFLSAFDAFTTLLHNSQVEDGEDGEDGEDDVKVGVVMGVERREVEGKGAPVVRVERRESVGKVAHVVGVKRKTIPSFKFQKKVANV